MSVTKWTNADSVRVRVGYEWNQQASSIYYWLLENIGVRGTGWETCDTPNSLDAEFLFTNKNHALMFRLRCGDFVVS